MAVRASRYDVVIAGGGLAGLTLGLQLKRARPQTSILIGDRRGRPAAAATFKVGESTSDLSAYYFRNVVGAMEHVDTEQIRKAGLTFYFTHGDNSDISQRVEISGFFDYEEAPSYQLDRGIFENELWRLNEQAGVELVRGQRAIEVRLGPDEHEVSLVQEDVATSVRCRWVVDASGRAGLLKRQLGLEQPNDHDVNAAWFRLAGGLDIQEWSSDPEWRGRRSPEQRRQSTAHLMGEGYWVWIINLISGPVSIGVCADPRYHPFEHISTLERMLEWMQRHEPQMAAEIERRRDQVLDFLTVKHFSHGCKRVYSPDRWCLTGEAGVFLDPLYSPGSNFIGISNTLITDMITRDLDGEQIHSPTWRGARARAFFAVSSRLAAQNAKRTSRSGAPFVGRAVRRSARDSRVEYYNFFYLRLYASALPFWRGQYGMFGNPQVMVAKILFEVVAGWTTGVNLFSHGKFTDPDFMSSIIDDLDRYSRFISRAERFLHDWDQLSRLEYSDVTVRFRDLEQLIEIRDDWLKPLDDEALRSRVADNFEALEALAVVFFHKAAVHLPKRPRADVPINPLAIGLDPKRWKRDGLLSAPGMTLAEATAKLPGIDRFMLDKRMGGEHIGVV